MENLAKSSPNEDLKKLAKLIDGIQVAMLTTIGENGEVHSRPMVTRQMGSDGDLWFLTRESSHKVVELNRTHRAHLTYVSPEQNKYVAVSGEGEIIRDQKKAEELWNPLYHAWFPKGLNDPELVCLKVQIQSAEYWDPASMAMIYLIGVPQAILTGKPYQPSEQEQKKIDLAG